MPALWGILLVNGWGDGSEEEMQNWDSLQSLWVDTILRDWWGRSTQVKWPKSFHLKNTSVRSVDTEK